MSDAGSAIIADLRDGGVVMLRPIFVADTPAVAELFSRLSAESSYNRFFHVRKPLDAAELRELVEVDSNAGAGIVAIDSRGGSDRLVGVAHYVRLADERAEVSFAVADEHQGRGIGTLLLEQLAGLARAQGIVELVADVLGRNHRMLEVFSHSGFELRQSSNHDIVRVVLATADGPAHVLASARREAESAARSLVPVLRPRSVALIGASRRDGSIGAAVLGNVIRGGFTGELVVVHPSAEEIGGLRTHRSLVDVGHPVDLAVIMVPSNAVESVVAECVTCGVRGAVVISSGFAEVGEEGRAAQDRIRDLARSHGMRLVGPNCMGILNTDPQVRLDATFAPTRPPEGNVAMASQSGAFGLAILERARASGLGLSSFVSLGNRADVSSNDLIAFWGEDVATRVILLYLESVGNPRKFARITRDVARRKPILAIKSGRSAAGTRAAASHSAALAGSEVGVDALFEQAGVIRVPTLETLFDAAALLSTQPLPRGDGVAIVTNAGGPAILLADACDAAALVVPELDDAIQAELRGFLPTQAAVRNPVDMIASATPEHYAATIAAVGRDPGVHAVVAIHVPPLRGSADPIAKAIAAAAAQLPKDKPILSVFLSSRAVPQAIHRGPRGAMPVFPYPENAAQALQVARRHARFRDRPIGEACTLTQADRKAVRAIVDRVAAAATSPTWLEPRDVEALLRAAGIEHAAAELVALADVRSVAERLGFPLVAKLVSPDVLHKSDVGGVVMGLRSGDEVEAAAQTFVGIASRLGARLDGILLQRQVESTIEAFVGVTTDPTFGPLVACGLGGTLVELLRDVAFRITPVTDLDAREMLASLRTRALLQGFRGRPPGDEDALVATVMRVSGLVEAAPEIVELDVNPIKVLPPGQGVVPVDARIRVATLALEDVKGVTRRGVRRRFRPHAP